MTTPHQETEKKEQSCCAGHDGGHSHAVKDVKPSAAAKFVCPMHPEVVAAESGKCPKCGMALKRSGATGKAPAHQH